MTVVSMCGAMETVLVEMTHEGLALSVGQGDTVFITGQVVRVDKTLGQCQPVSKVLGVVKMRGPRGN